MPRLLGHPPLTSACLFHRSHPHELALGSELSHSIVTVISGEEHFEDYGEGNEADLFPDPLCNGESSFGSSSFLSPR